MIILCHQPNPHNLGGYGSIYYMAQLASRLFGAEVINAAPPRGRAPLYLAAAQAMLGSRRRGEEPCLVIARLAGGLNGIVQLPGWRSRVGMTVGWVIDSFAEFTFPKTTRFLHAYDHMFVGHLEDVDFVQRKLGVPASWLPMGSDVLRFGGDRSDRAFDVLRVGRQPAEWSDDQINAQACQARGLSFHGRPPGDTADAEKNQAAIHTYGSMAKFALAFSNVAAPAPYTHPVRDYITTRWTDMISSGATVAGVCPSEADVAQLFWPEATLELNSIEREKGLDVLAEAVQDWAPERAAKNRAMALQRLDWRWRFLEIADHLGIHPPELHKELDEIRKAAVNAPMPT